MLKVYKLEEGETPIKDASEAAKITSLLEGCRFYQQLDHFADSDKMDLLQCFEL